MRVNWIGGATVRLEMGAFRILTDPTFCEGPRALAFTHHPSTGETNVSIARLAPLPPVELDDLDLLIVSHLHSDHFDPCAVGRLDKDLETTCPPPNVAQLRDWGFGDVQGLDWGDERIWEKDGERLRVRAVPAHHSHDPDHDHALGMVNGYVIEHASATSTERIYWTGDTVWFEAMRDEVAAMARIDLLLPHLGGVGKYGPWGLYSLDADEGVQVVRLVDPGTVIPIHHSTFTHYVEPISVFADRLGASDYAGRLVVLPEGETWTSEPLGREIDAAKSTSSGGD